MHGPPGRPVVLAIPPMGDTAAAQYGRLLPRLEALGLRVLMMDLRGHGASDATFASYAMENLAADVLAVLDDAGVARAVLLGNSAGAAAAVLAASRHPDRVAGLALLGPVVRDLPADRFFRPLVPLLFAAPWGARAWAAFHGTLYKKHRPDDLAARQQFLRAHLREPGRLRALRALMRASKSASEAALASVRAPALVLMGTRDPDFPDAVAEAELLRARLAFATVRLFEGVGHYPHLEEPEEVAAALGAWLAREAPARAA